MPHSPTHPPSWRLIILALLVSSGTTAVAQEPAGAPPTILEQINAAVAAGAHKVRIKPGIYTLTPEKPHGAHLMLGRLQNLEIDARGVTMVCTRPNTAMEISTCQNITLRGLTIDYDPLPLTQGTIVAFAPDRTWTDVKIHTGYPAPDVTATNSNWPDGGQGFIWTLDRRTRLYKPGTANRFARDITPQGDGVYRLLHGSASYRDQADVGDYLRIPQKFETATGVNLWQCKQITLQEVTLSTAPQHFGFAARYCADVTFQKVRIQPGPPPKGATEPRLFTTVGDGINLAGITGKLVVEDCDLAATGDDGIAVYTEPGLVVRTADERHLTLGFSTGGHPPIAPGTLLRVLCQTNGTIEEAEVVSSTPSTMRREDIEPVRNQAIKSAQGFLAPLDIQLSRPVHARPGDQAALLDEQTQETLIRRNRIVNAGSRGIVANRSRCRIEGNTISHTYLPGIHVFAFFHSEGGPGFQEDVRIIDNRLEDTCVGWPGNEGWLGAISVVDWDDRLETFGGHRRVVIEDNVIAKAWGNNIQVQTATGVTIRHNHFDQAHLLQARPSKVVDNGSLIFLRNVRDAVVVDNAITAPGPHAGNEPLICREVTGLKAEKPFRK